MAFFGAIVVACAVSVPPSGGPEDKTAPQVSGTFPPPDSAGIAPDSPIQISFSEPIQREGFIRNVVFSPPVEIARVRWKGNTVTIEPYDSLHPDTTYVVSLESGYRDEHNVTADRRFEFAFATSAQLDTGTVSGIVHFRREPTEKGIVHGFVLPGDSGFSPETAEADRQARTNRSGAYTLRYLPGSNNRFLVWAFHDHNGNGSFDPDTEYGAVLPDTLVLSSDRPSWSSRDIYIVDPTEPAVVSGIIEDATGIDTAFVSVGLYAATDTLAPSYFTYCDTLGAYSFRSVESGVYAIAAFMDFAPDSVCGVYPCPGDSARSCVEPCVAGLDSVRANPGDDIEWPKMTLLAPEEGN